MGIFNFLKKELTIVDVTLSFHPYGRKFPRNAMYVAKLVYGKQVAKNRNSFEFPTFTAMVSFKFKGGVICFSTDLNTTEINASVMSNKLKSKIKSKLKMIAKCLNKDKKIDNVLNKNKEFYKELKKDDWLKEDIGWFLGNFFKGRYRDQNGNVWNEKSLTVYLTNVPSFFLRECAIALAKEFDKKAVLVRDYNEDRIYIIYTLT